MHTFYRTFLGMCAVLILSVTLTACGDADDGAIEEERIETMDTDTVEIETDTMMASPDTTMLPGDAAIGEEDAAVGEEDAAIDEEM